MLQMNLKEDGVFYRHRGKFSFLDILVLFTNNKLEYKTIFFPHTSFIIYEQDY